MSRRPRKETPTKGYGFIAANGWKERPSQPDIKGHVIIVDSDGDEQKYWVAGWQKTNNVGDYVSLSLTHDPDFKKNEDYPPPTRPSQYQGGTPKPSPTYQAPDKVMGNSTNFEDFDDDIPF